MARRGLTFAWIASIAVHAVAALVVIHAVPTREPAPLTQQVFLTPLGPGTGQGGGMPTAPPAPEPPPPPVAAPAPPPPPTPKPSLAKPRPVAPKPRPAPRDVPAAPPSDATASATTLGPGGAPGDGSGPGAGGGSPSGSPLGTPAVPPAVLTRVPPVYPPHARESGVEGAVVLLAIVSEDGRIETPVRVSRSIPALDGAAIAALERWRFRPGRDASGRPVRVEVEIPIRFELR